MILFGNFASEIHSYEILGEATTQVCHTVGVVCNVSFSIYCFWCHMTFVEKKSLYCHYLLSKQQTLMTHPLGEW